MDKSDGDQAEDMHEGLTARENGLSGGRYSPHHLWEGSSKRTRPRNHNHHATRGGCDGAKTTFPAG